MNTRQINTRLLLLALLCMLTANTAGAQGFVRQYPFAFFSFQGGPQSVFPQANGGFRLSLSIYPDVSGQDLTLLWVNTDAQGIQTSVDNTSTADFYALEDGIFMQEDGSFFKAQQDTNRITVTYFEPSGAAVWVRDLDFPGYIQANVLAVRPNADGAVFVRGYAINTVITDGFVLKLDTGGNLLWQAEFPMDLTYIFPKVLQPTSDGGCLLANYKWDPVDTTEQRIIKVDNNGAIQWSYAPANGFLQLLQASKLFALNNNQDVILPAFYPAAGGQTNDLYAEKLSPAGALLFSANLSTASGLNNLQPRLAFPTNDGGAIIVASYYLLNSWTNYVFRVTSTGTVAWKRPLSVLTDAMPAAFADGKELSDGNLVLYGNQGYALFLIKMSPEGVIYPHTLNGQVVRDSTYNCLADVFDPPLAGWVVHAAGNGQTNYGVSGADGRYTIPDLDTGAYQLVLTAPSYLWQVCNDTVPVQFSGATPQIDTADFPVQALYDCPLMQVDLGAPVLRRCFNSDYVVNYCNAGNTLATDAVVTVELDPLLTVVSASVPYTQSGQTLTFGVGAVAAGACGSFRITVMVSCAAELGQTLCAEAHITPDTLCAPNLPGWSGARIEVTAECTGDSVMFRIKNTGNAPTSQPLEFIIVDDHVITRQGSFLLGPGSLQEEWTPADGSTWRLIAQQEPGYPFGPQNPSVGVEGCSSSGTGPFSWGMLNLFANYSGNPFNAAACRTVVGSWDPNDKQAFPTGVDAPHYIEQNQPLQYVIRFQNTGTDTAFTVVVRDTLSPLLDPATIRPGPASHPYTWSISGQGVLTVVFEHIMLPDSNANETASHGFVQFNIGQMPDNPLGTVVENRAGIYFDFNAPVLTNTVFHTIGKDFLLVAGPGPKPDLPLLRVWPTPARADVLVELQGGALFRPGQRLCLRDVAGRMVREEPAGSPQQTLQRLGLPAGMYWLEWRDANRILAAGKVVWMDE